MRKKQRQPELGRTLSPSEKRFLEGLRKDQKPSYVEPEEELVKEGFDERPIGPTESALPIA